MKKITITLTDGTYNKLNNLISYSNKRTFNIMNGLKATKSTKIKDMILLYAELLEICSKYDPFENMGIFSTDINADEISETDKNNIIKLLLYTLKKGE